MKKRSVKAHTLVVLEKRRQCSLYVLICLLISQSHWIRCSKHTNDHININIISSVPSLCIWWPISRSEGDCMEVVCVETTSPMEIKLEEFSSDMQELFQWAFREEEAGGGID